MIVNRKVSIELEEKDKELLRAAHALMVDIVDTVGAACAECPLRGVCDGKTCPDGVIEDVFFELTGEVI